MLVLDSAAWQTLKQRSDKDEGAKKKGNRTFTSILTSFFFFFVVVVAGTKNFTHAVMNLIWILHLILQCVGKRSFIPLTL